MHFSNDKSNYTSIKSCESPKVIIQQVNKCKDTQKQTPDNDVDSRPGAVLRSVGAEPGSGGWDPSSATSGPEPHSLTLPVGGRKWWQLYMGVWRFTGMVGETRLHTGPVVHTQECSPLWGQLRTASPMILENRSSYLRQTGPVCSTKCEEKSEWWERWGKCSGGGVQVLLGRV